MLELWGRSFRNCDRVSRRSVLRIGSLALGGVTLADLLRRRAFASPQAQSPTDTAVIQLFLGGGPSQLDTFDLKPDAPADIRGEFHEISTSVPGIRISEHLPRLAAVMDKFSVVRSVTHDSSSHLPSSHLMQTGYIDPNAISGRNMNPSTGSIVARVRGPDFSRFADVRVGAKTTGVCRRRLSGRSVQSVHDRRRAERREFRGSRFEDSVRRHAGTHRASAHAAARLGQLAAQLGLFRPNRRHGRVLSAGDGFDHQHERHPRFRHRARTEIKCASVTADHRWDRTCCLPGGWSSQASAT